ncbi:deoxyadenosine/deoxycytidine kinase [Spiroplasma gladiatoris]|uniref:Deoxyadenosine/deoxycytidine kinase n=1 Tax=Spiroplasma gladiatoris TaxID=2143 RepID=A0A4P7AH45_9MOLU|nr:deoxynucleoside kinase [Spiroplasma gladiatoris]QBQ07492.1 deoxyadenosine/deoxycytidine kinase [Spiroplasma gladiatoris]
MRIAFFGTVGSGKTTLIQRFAKTINHSIVLEPIYDCPYFEKHYEDMKNQAFKIQIYMLSARAKQLIETKNNFNIIFDRTILEDLVFTKTKLDMNYMNKVDYQTYLDLFNTIVLPNLAQTTNFDLVIYLKVSDQKSLERIKARGRKEEIEINEKYWETLNKNYEHFFGYFKKNFNFFVINGNDDNLENKLNKLEKKVSQMLKDNN